MKMKQIETLAAIFLGSALGSIILWFAAPILLAILVSGASLMVPFLIYHLFVTKGWKIRLEREKDGSVAQKGPEQNHVNGQEENDSECGEEEAA